MADATAGQILTAAFFNHKTRKVVARARRTTSSSGTTGSAVGVLRLDGKPLVGGVEYRITWKATFDVGTAGDQLRGQIHFTTNNTSATTSSSLLAGSASNTPVADAAESLTATGVTSFIPSSDQTVSLLLAIQRLTGSGTGIMQGDGGLLLTEMWIDSMGDDPGNTGTSI